MKQQLLDTLEQIAGKENIHPNEPMSRHTTFRVGGPADVLVTPEAEKLAAVTGACREAGEPYYIVGNGSNLLVGDGGIRGVVILTRDGMDEISADGVRITAGAGALLSRTASLAADRDGICSRDSGNDRRCSCDECGSLRRRDAGHHRDCDRAR